MKKKPWKVWGNGKYLGEVEMVLEFDIAMGKKKVFASAPAALNKMFDLKPSKPKPSLYTIVYRFSRN